MKAILEFNLPEEREEHALACRARDLDAALCDVRRHVRDRLKYADLSDLARAELETVRALLLELIDS